jgi:hypothetical protein
MSSSVSHAGTSTEVQGERAASDSAARLPSLSWAKITAFIRQEKYWLLLAIPYFFAWYIPQIPPFTTLFPGMTGPANWAEHEWFVSIYPQMFQPWVLPMAGLLIWSRRQDLARVWARVKMHPPTKFWQRGNVSVLILGCLFLLFAHFVKVKGIAVIGLLLIPIGLIYQVYGLAIIRAMWVPLLFATLMIPPPDSAMTRLISLFHSGTLLIASMILNRIGMPNGRNGYTLQFYTQGGFGVEYATPVSSIVILLPLLVILLWYGLFRRLRPAVVVGLLIGGTIFAMLVNLLRIIIIAKLQLPQPATASFLMNMNAWPLIGVSFALTLGALRLFSVAPKHVPSQKTGRAINKAGQFVNLLLSPFVALLTSLGKIGLLWKASERGIENILSGKSKRRKRGR